jgi:hypothetical protein
MGLASMTVWFRRVALIAVGSVLAWRVIILGMAEFYAVQIEKNPAAAVAALGWYPQHPKALLSLAGQKMVSEPAQAEAMLIQAWRGDPTDGDILLRLAVLWRTQGQIERADRACDLAERLFPADAQFRLQIAQYWVVAGNLSKVLYNWDLAMQIDETKSSSLFPVLLNIANDPASLSMLAPIAAALPSWWQNFFVYVAQNAEKIDTPRGLYSLRQAGGKPFTSLELNAYVARLMRENFWFEAYMAWVNALRPEQQQVLGYLYDGGFEQTSFQGGFDWSMATTKSLQISTYYTQGTIGKKSLHIVFKGKSSPSAIIEQTVFLLPGHYRLSGKVRPDALQIGIGLEWEVRCQAGMGSILATSERFVGSDLWRSFNVDFTVTSDACSGVKLRLQPVGYVQGADTISKGEIWFDDLVISLVGDSVDAAPNALPSQQKAVSAGEAVKKVLGNSVPRKSIGKPLTKSIEKKNTGKSSASTANSAHPRIEQDSQ